MFKLESYITPILLSYVEKYVKNIKAEQSQVSLWGGDVSFSNLDLRLDVLEHELGLPFSFVSGHIHELQIHVPWTRLNAEPIVITINTIECVLKLPSGDDESDASSLSSSATIAASRSVDRRSKKQKRTSGEKEGEAPPTGYVQSLINKIISNVTIVCNNLILKYVEEDIVLSLNTRHLKVCSANELWEPAFTELSLPDLIIRKLVEVTDLTICLDRRNASGKIDNYQEPLLYRCSLSIHAAWCYDALLSKRPSTSRIEVKCPKLDFSLTGSQIPMFMRILKLALALYYGEIAAKRRRGQQKLQEASGEGADGDKQEGHEGGHNESWSGWAWNVGSSVGTALLPVYWEDDEYEYDVPQLDVKRDLILHFGLYIDTASLVLKLTDHLGDNKSMFGSTKQCFTPFIRMDCFGIFQEVVVKGIGLVNVSGGVSQLLVTPVGDCVCGITDTKLGGKETETPYVECGKSDKKEYLRGSLFEKDFGSEDAQLPKERRKSYQIDWDSHLEMTSEEKMLDRSPACAFDFLYCLDIPPDYTSEQLSELGYDLEYSNLSERALVRLVLGPSTSKICSGFLHRLQLVQHFCSFYDYSPYQLDIDLDAIGGWKEKKGEEDTEALCQGPPMRVYQVTAINPTVVLYSADHPLYIPHEIRMRSTQATPVRATSLENILGVALKIECVDAQLSQPMYPKRLVKAILSMKDPPKSLKQSCQNYVTTKLVNLSGQLLFNGQTSTVLQPSCCQFTAKKVPLIDQWKDTQHHSMAKKGFTFDLSSLKMRATRPQYLAVTHVFNSHFERNPKPSKLMDTTLLEDALTRRMSSFFIHFSGLRVQYDLTEKVHTLQAGLENIVVNLCTVSKENSLSTVLPIFSRADEISSGVSSSSSLSSSTRSPIKSSPGRAQTNLGGGKLEQNHELLVSACAQFPSDMGDQECLSLLVCHVSQVQVSLDPKVYDWFLYFPTAKHTIQPSSSRAQLLRETSVATSVETQQAYAGSPSVRSKTPTQSGIFFMKSKKSPSPAREVKSSVKSAGTSEKGGTLLSARKKRAGKSSMHGTWVARILEWFPTLNSMLIQLRIEGHELFFPKKSLSTVAGKTVGDSIRRSQTSKEDFPIFGLSLPTVTLENVAHKPMIQQFLSSIPFEVPDSVWTVQRDNLPWTLVLADFSIFSFSRGRVNERSHLLEPVSTSCTLGLTVKKLEGGADEEERSVAFCIHTDMSPIRARLNETHLSLLILMAEELLAVLARFHPKFFPTKQQREPPSQDEERTHLSSPEGSSTGPSIARPNFEAMSDTAPSQLSDVFDVTASADKAISLWLQWTVPQMSLQIVAREANTLHQLGVVMEDCQTSFDWTPVYFKMKCLVLSASINSQTKTAGGVWGRKSLVLSCTDDISHDFHHINSKTNTIELHPHTRHFETDSSLFNLVFTRAECANVRKKWSDMLRRKTATPGLDDPGGAEGEKRFVCEMDVKLAPIDLVFAPSDMIPFVKMFSKVLAMKIPPSFLPQPAVASMGRRKDVLGIGFNNNTIPLVYVKAKTVRIFLLSSQSNEKAEYKPADHCALAPDFLLLQIDSIIISPQVENPLSRILIRPDLYHLATPILSVPGSQIEDRQYQTDITGLGIYTGCWSDVLKKSEKPVKPQLKTMGENPALEWNTTMELSDEQLLQAEVLLVPILSKFDLQILLAPAIVLYQQRPGSSKISKKLVAGHAVEVNATNEAAIYLSLNQISFCSDFAQRVIDNIGIICSSLRPTVKSNLDSGIDCDGANSSQAKIQQDTLGATANKGFRFVPIEILITGSQISCSVFRLEEGERDATKKDRNMWRKYRYKHRRLEILEERVKQSIEESDGCTSEVNEEALKNKEAKNIASILNRGGSFDIGYDASEEGSIEELHETIKIFPIFHLKASQPHMFLTCSKEKQKLEFSVFDASLNLAPPDYFITCGGKRLPDIMDFPTHWFQTKQGDADPKSGIPPALLTCTVTDFVFRPLGVALKIERPLKFDLGEELWRQLLFNAKVVQEALNIGEIMAKLRPEEEKKKAKTETTFSSLRRELARLSSLSVTTKQVTVHYPFNEKKGAYQPPVEAVVGVMGLSCNANFSSRLHQDAPSLEYLELSGCVDRLLLRLCLAGITHNVVGPWSMQLKSQLSWISHSQLPSLFLNLDSDLLPIKIGPNMLLALRTISNSSLVKGSTSEEDEEGLSKACAGSEETPSEILPSQSAPAIEQHYIDDLRAGAFQYITEGNSSDPKPYQVVFSDSPSSMTWRYPQPRTLTRVSVFPVPFMSATDQQGLAGKADQVEDDDAGQEEVLCALQYWDVCLSNFQTYSEFTLSEHHVSHLNLPTVGDRKRCAVSSTWRVLLYYNDGEDEGESQTGNPSKPVVIATPKSLVSVIRIDSYYSSKLIPSFQASATLPAVVIDFSNQLQFHGRRLTGKNLTHYTLCQNFPLEHNFGSVRLDNFSLGVDAWLGNGFQDFRTHLKLKTLARIDLLDYVFLASHPLTEPTKMQGQLTFCRSSADHSLELQVHSKPLIFRVGHFVGHTLNVSADLWKSVLGQKDSDLLASFERPIRPLTHYIICNETSEPIRFGQADTEENLLLKTRECCMYSWRSPKARLLLRVCVEGGFWKWCEPFPIVTEPGAQTTRTIHHGSHQSVIVIATVRLSTTQTMIKVCGLLSTASLLKDSLEVRVMLKPYETPASKEMYQEHRSVLESFSTTPSFVVQAERVQGVKIRLLGIGTPWSGEIPLQMDKARRKSVLVRIPTKEKGKCLTIWCRLVEESLDNGMTRSLLLFSPMYMARSLMASPIKVILNSSNVKGSEKQIALPGRDLPIQLETVGPSDQKYSIAFKVVDDLPPSDPIGMSWGMVEQVRDSVLPAEDEKIDKVIDDIGKYGPQDLQTNWPFIESDGKPKLPISHWTMNEQPKTDVQINFTQFHPLCNTLCVDINPWCLIVNQLGLPLVLKCGETKNLYDIANESVIVPPQLPSTFFFGILDNAEHAFSPPMQLSDQEWRFKRKLMPSVQGIVPMEGLVQTKIVLDQQICFLTLQSRNEHGMRVIHVTPTFVLCNRAGMELQAAPLSVMRVKARMDIERLELANMDVAGGGEEAVPLLLWQIVGETAKKQLFDGFQHLSLSMPDCPWSLPLNLEDCRNIEEDRKRALFVPQRGTDGEVNVSLVMTIHPRNGQIYLVINKDEAPAIIIQNNLEIPIRYAQSTKQDGIDIGDDFFTCQSLQIVGKGQRAHYSYPWHDLNFPSRTESQDLPLLVLAAANQSKPAADADWEVLEDGLRWSSPIDSSLHHDEFLHLHGVGDIKVVVETVGHSSFVFVDPVSKIEISAKDIRSRIALAEENNEESNDESVADETFASIPDDAHLVASPTDSESSFFTVASPDESRRRRSRASGVFTQYHSLVEEETTRKRLEVTTNVFFDGIVLVLEDDCRDKENEKTEFIRLTLDTLSLSIRPRFLYTKPLRCCANELPRQNEVTLCVNNIQLDNQMFLTYPHDFSVIVLGQNPKDPVRLSCHTTELMLEELKANSLVCVQMLFDSSSLDGSRDALKKVNVRVDPLSINLEDQFMYKMLEILSSFNFASGQEEEDSPAATSNIPDQVLLSSNSMLHELCLKEFLVNPIDVSMSVHASIKMYIGLDQSPLNFSAFHRRDLRTTNYCLGQLLARHYISGALFRAGWVVGSLDLIGSPSGFTRTIGDGLKDFVAMPYQGMVHGPWAFVSGITHGSSSLVKHISAGTLTSMTNFASSVSRNLDRLSLDQEHQQRNEVFRRHKPQGVGQGLLNGLSGVGISLLGAVGGIAHHPLHALMEQGMSPTGLVAGLTRGLVGAVTKPLGGAAEFVAQTGQGLLHGTGWSTNHRQRYPPVPEPVCGFACSSAKFAWKMLSPCPGRSALSQGMVLFVADVTSGMTPVTLLLTHDSLLQVASDEDAVETVYPLDEIKFLACPEDPTRMNLIVEDEVGAEQHHDRVAQFVMETGMQCTVSEDMEEVEADLAEAMKEEDAASEPPPPVVEAAQSKVKKEMTFYASPVTRTAFLGLFHIAKRQIRRKGFDML